jgi:uncharacterized protein YcbX
MPRLARITVYPVKSLPGVDVDQAALTTGGALRHDREYAIVDAQGNYINGKRTHAIHRLDAACAIDGDTVCVTLSSGGGAQTFALNDSDAVSRTALEARLSHYFGEPVQLKQNTQGGFPDDPEASGPTVIATASLAEAAKWYTGFTIDDIRRRFRANLELADCPAFWEDRLFGDADSTVKFRVGDAQLLGTNPCKRCVVPTRDPSSGDELIGFQRTFVQQRKATLPAWANRARFDFYYRLATNTRSADDVEGKTIRVGDIVEML